MKKGFWPEVAGVINTHKKAFSVATSILLIVLACINVFLFNGVQSSRASEYVANGDFEANSSGLPTGWTGVNSVFSVDSASAYSGSNSLRMKDSNTYAYTANAGSNVFSLQPGTYTLSYWAKGSALGATTVSTSGLNAYLYNKGTNTSLGSTTVKRGTFDWTLVQKDFTVTVAGNYYVYFTAYQRPDGTAWIDQVSFVDKTAAPADVLAPSVPGNVTATSTSESQVNLSWSAATDDVAVAGYRIYRDGNQVATTASLAYSDTGLAAATSYSYAVAAFDAAGNVSAQSASVSVTTQNTPPPPQDTTAPVVSNGSPAGVLASNVTQTTLSVVTNENATCKYDTNANTGFADMSNAFSSTGGATHSAALTGLSSGNSYTYYVRCSDTAGNVNNSDYAITFSVASATSSAPASGAGSVYDVKAGYSCSGDGLVDDSTCVASAISAADSGKGGIVWFPAGTYKTTQSFAVPSNVTVQCAPGAIIKRSGNSLLFSFTASNAAVKNCTLDGDNVAGKAMIAISTDKVFLDSNIFQNTGNNGHGAITNGIVQITSGTQITIARNKFLAVPNDVIWADNTNTVIKDISVFDNYIEQTAVDSYAVAFRALLASPAMSGIQVSRNVVRSSGPCYYNIAADNKILHAVYQGNYCYRTAASGTYGYSIFGMTSSVMQGNVYDDMGFGHGAYGGFGIHDCYDSVISGNTAYLTTGDIGFTLLDVARNTYTGNNIYNGGYYWANSASGSAINDNNITGNVATLRSGSTNAFGFKILCGASGKCDRNSLVGNRVVGAGNNTGSSGIILVGNGMSAASNYIANNSISNVPTGINISTTGVTQTKVDDQMFVGVTTPVVDLGAGSLISTHTVRGGVTLSGGTAAVSFTGPQAFTATTTYDCMVRDASNPANPVSVTLTSGVQLDLSGTDGDTVKYICTGY